MRGVLLKGDAPPPGLTLIQDRDLALAGAAGAIGEKKGKGEPTFIACLFDGHALNIEISCHLSSSSLVYPSLLQNGVKITLRVRVLPMTCYRCVLVGCGMFRQQEQV